MAKCEGKGALTQWKWHRMRRVFFRIESGLLACDSNNITVACEKTRTRLAKNSPLSATRQKQQILDLCGELCIQQQASQGKCDLRDACDPHQQHRLQVSVKERSECMHALSRTENQAGHKSPSNSPEIFMAPSSYQQTTVRQAYRTECPVQTEGSQNDIIERRLLTFSIR